MNDSGDFMPRYLLFIPLVGLVFGCGDRPQPQPQPGSSLPVSVDTTGTPIRGDDTVIASQVAHFCGACHATPEPHEFPRHAWREEVEQGYQLYVQSGRTDLTLPKLSEVVNFYERQAPETLSPPPSIPSVDAGGLSFLQEPSPGAPAFPALAHLKWADMKEQGHHLLLTADMKSGEVRGTRLEPQRIEAVFSVALKNPCHVEPTDLNADGRTDFLIADLGSYRPADHDQGRVIWLHESDSKDWISEVLAEGLGRVADVQAADIDHDTDLDLVVAEFGWRQTGRVLLLENTRDAERGLKFQTHILDSRHGAIHVPVHDWNQDGNLDISVLLSQEHESVELLLGDGRGAFQPQRIFAGGTAAYGSTGIAIADLDGDGDHDILYTNGDMFDDFYLRETHGVVWLENRGQQEFFPRPLWKMPGIHRALPADLDGDGDQDVVVCAFIPAHARGSDTPRHLASLAWLEQTRPGVFAPHVLEVEECRHASLEVADFDADGDLDLAVGNFCTTEHETDVPFEIWWNQRHR